MVYWIPIRASPASVSAQASRRKGPPKARLRVRQRRVDAFQHEFKTERPHAALRNVTPANHCKACVRPYPRHLADPEYPAHYPVRYVSRNGGVRWHNRWVNASHVRAEGYVGVEEVAGGIWSAYFGPVVLGRFDDRDVRIHGAHNRNKHDRR